MGALHARSQVRRGIGVLAAVLLLMSVAPQPSARASGAPSGSLTYAYAENPTPVLDQSTVVWFGASVPLGNVIVVLYDEKGTYLTECYQGNTCNWLVNPGPGETKTITAVLRTQVDGQRVVLDTASVSVTDPGYPGDFSYARADNPSPAVDQSTLVWFGVSEPLNAAVIDIRDELGTLLVECYQRDSCTWLANPSPGETKTYTATLRVQLNGHWVDHSTRSVTVTDPGWTGTITPDANNPGFVTAGTQAWVHFATVAPRGSADVKVYVDGVLRTTCNAQGGDLLCNANFGVGANEVHVVRADVVHYLIGGTQEVRASATSVVTSKTPEQFADWMLDPTSNLGELGTPELQADLAALGTAADIAEICFNAGVLYKDIKKLRGSPPDLTLVCDAAGLTARDFLATLVVALGATATVAVVHQVIHPAAPDPAPEPEPQPPNGGGNEPPPVVVDTCQLPPGADPEVFYFYQRTAQAQDILASGVRDVGGQGKIWFSNVLYSSGAEAAGPLALPDPLPDGYFEIPRDRLQDLFGPYCVDPAFGQSGGGVEYWTTQPIEMGGLEWHPFP